jgi:spore maturation protein SpmB
MCTFLAINTSSVQLVPATAVSILAVAGAKDPTAIIGTAFLATTCSTIAGLTAVKLLEKLPAYRLPQADLSAKETDPTTTADGEELASERTVPRITFKGKLLLTLFLVLFGLIFAVLRFPDAANGVVASLGQFAPQFFSFQFAPLSSEMQQQGGFSRSIGVISLLAVPFLLSFFPLYASVRGVKVYEEFVEGAKEGFQVAVRIIPFLVAILVAVKMFREAGGIAMLSQLLSPLLNAISFPVDLLPLVLIRPLSGGASLGMFSELVTQFGPDHLISRTAATIFGSTETTFYVVAVYFGSVAVRRTRHAVPAGLIADAVGVIASVIICRAMFG